MKHYLLTIGLLLIFTNTYSQELFEIKDKRNKTKNTEEFLRKRPWKKFYNIQLNPEVLNCEDLFVNLPEKGKVKFNSIENTRKKWIGIDAQETSSIIIIKGDSSMIGSINYEGDIYQIYSFNDKEAVLLVLDPEELPEIECGTENLNHKESDIHNNTLINPSSVTDENLRILVAYTPAAENGIQSDIHDFITLAIEETNLSYLNSRIPHKVELAAIVKVDYIESSSFSTDLSRFRNLNDGYMDEIHALRDLYAADVCVLILNNPEYCGLATTINAISTSAFCGVHYTCATGGYTFAHEIGHLQGARHDRYMDFSSTPYQYGHGYVSPGYNWRTVMAYADACGSCKRIPYWSNPNIIYSDGRSMGTVEYENNAQVLNYETPRLKLFRNSLYNATITANSVKNIKYAELTATSSIITNGSFSLPTSSEINFSAPEVILNAGFTIPSGTLFTIK